MQTPTLRIAVILATIACYAACSSEPTTYETAPLVLSGLATTDAATCGTTPDAAVDAAPVDASTADASAHDASAADSSAPLPLSWLYTVGNHIYEASGRGTGIPWMGRGVNVDDVYFCGFNNIFWMSNPDVTLEAELSTMVAAWKPTFVRISLDMDSFTDVSTWVGASTYKTQMTAVIQSLTSRSNMWVLVTLRSDASMIGQDTADGDPEATGLPSASTDPTYVALVDSFGPNARVIFGLSNEPGGDKLSSATIAAAMTHAAQTIRAEEDAKGYRHHVISVQGNAWTSDLSYYATAPIPVDNIAYEYHAYPPVTAAYTYANLPIIIGEYGNLTTATAPAFYADVEAKQIPNLAWDFDSYNNCSPDLVNVNQSSTSITPTAWGSIVQAYLLAH